MITKASNNAGSRLCIVIFIPILHFAAKRRHLVGICRTVSLRSYSFAQSRFGATAAIAAKQRSLHSSVISEFTVPFYLCFPCMSITISDTLKTKQKTVAFSPARPLHPDRSETFLLTHSGWRLFRIKISFVRFFTAAVGNHTVPASVWFFRLSARNRGLPGLY